MAISTGGMNQAMGFYDPNDRFRQLEEQARYEYMRAQQYQRGLGNAVGIQQAQPVPNPEPNKVLLLLE